MKLHEASKNRCILLPRSHRKTTYCTKVDALQIALPDDLGTAPYPRNLGPNVRICLIHESDRMASRFLQEITNWVTSNELLRFLFPEIIPTNREQRINITELELRRTASWSEPTFDTMGVGTKSQGRHYNRLKLDDIYGTDARDSQAMHERTIQWFDEIEPYLVTPLSDGFDLIGTRYNHKDVYSHAFEKYGDSLPRYVRSVIEFNPETQSYEPIFPEMFTLESLAHLKKNRKLWTANYLNAPDFREQHELDPAWLRYYQWAARRNQIHAFTGTERLTRDVEGLDKVLFIDPAVEGDAGWIITGTDYISNKPNIFVLEAQRGPIPPDKMIPKIFAAVEKWQLRAVVIEEVLFSRLYRHWLQSEMRHRGMFFNVIPAKTRQKAKDARVLGLAPYFSAGQIWFNQEQTALVEEYMQFGLGNAYHMLDALAYGPEFWRSSVNRSRIEEQKNAEQKFLSLRDPLTGYTRIA